MEQFSLYSQEMETQRRMQEAQQWAANERLARQARAGQPSFARRIVVVFKRMTMLPSSQQRAPRRRTAASTAKLTHGDVLIL